MKAKDLRAMREQAKKVRWYFDIEWNRGAKVLRLRGDGCLLLKLVEIAKNKLVVVYNSESRYSGGASRWKLDEIRSPAEVIRAIELVGKGWPRGTRKRAS